ncbi:hypothetical protein [Aeromonas salmonicida]
MTVSVVTPRGLVCNWFDNEQKFQSVTIPGEALKAYQPEDF